MDSKVNKRIKIFITGGTGLIGSYVLRALRSGGYENIIASRRISSKMNLVEDIDGIEWKNISLFDISGLQDILEQCDAVIHIAGVVSFSPRRKKELYKTNVEGVANLVNIAIDTNIKRFIHFSSVAALGISQKPIDETAVWTEHNSRKHYSLSKYLGEREAWRGFAEGLNLSIINPSFTLGAGFWNYGPMSFVKRMAKGGKFYPLGSNGCVDVRDVALMCAKLLESNDLSGRRFICSGHNICHKDLMHMFCEEFKSKPPNSPISTWLGNLMWRSASLWSNLSQKETLFSRETYEITKAPLSYDNSSSINLLDMKYRPLAATISDTVSTYVATANNGYGIFK